MGQVAAKDPVGPAKERPVPETLEHCQHRKPSEGDSLLGGPLHKPQGEMPHRPDQARDHCRPREGHRPLQQGLHRAPPAHLFIAAVDQRRLEEDHRYQGQGYLGVELPRGQGNDRPLRQAEQQHHPPGASTGDKDKPGHLPEPSPASAEHPQPAHRGAKAPQQMQHYSRRVGKGQHPPVPQNRQPAPAQAGDGKGPEQETSQRAFHDTYPPWFLFFFIQFSV